MTMRDLTPDEIEKTNNGIDRLTQEIDELKDNIEFNLRTIEFQKMQSVYQDFARPYLRNKKELEDNKTIILMEQDLMSKEQIVTDLRTQIKKGVEIKNKG